MSPTSSKTTVSGSDLRSAAWSRAAPAPGRRWAGWRCPPASPPTRHPYTLHPAFLDAALHIWPAAMPDQRAIPPGCVPIAVEQLTVYRTPQLDRPAWVHAVHAPQDGPDQLRFDLTLRDLDGGVLAELRGLRAASIEAGRPRAAAPATSPGTTQATRTPPAPASRRRTRCSTASAGPRRRGAKPRHRPRALSSSQATPHPTLFAPPQRSSTTSRAQPRRPLRTAARAAPSSGTAPRTLSSILAPEPPGMATDLESTARRALNTTDPGRWLILADSTGVAEQIAAALRARGHSAALAYPGPAYAHLAPDRYAIRPASPDDYARLLAEACVGPPLASERAGRTASPYGGIVHLWPLSPPAPDEQHACPPQGAQSGGWAGAPVSTSAPAPSDRARLDRGGHARHRRRAGAGPRADRPGRPQPAAALAGHRRRAGDRRRQFRPTCRSPQRQPAPPAAPPAAESGPMVPEARPASLDQAPLWGFGRTLQHEHPECGARLVDLDARPRPAEIALLVEELLHPRRGAPTGAARRHAPRRAPGPRHARAARVRACPPGDTGAHTPQPLRHPAGPAHRRTRARRRDLRTLPNVRASGYRRGRARRRRRGRREILLPAGDRRARHPGHPGAAPRGATPPWAGRGRDPGPRRRPELPRCAPGHGLRRRAAARTAAAAGQGGRRRGNGGGRGGQRSRPRRSGDRASARPTPPGCSAPTLPSRPHSPTGRRPPWTTRRPRPP